MIIHNPHLIAKIIRVYHKLAFYPRKRKLVFSIFTKCERCENYFMFEKMYREFKHKYIYPKGKQKGIWYWDFKCMKCGDDKAYCRNCKFWDPTHQLGGSSYSYCEKKDKRTEYKDYCYSFELRGKT